MGDGKWKMDDARPPKPLACKVGRMTLEQVEELDACPDSDRTGNHDVSECEASIHPRGGVASDVRNCVTRIRHFVSF